MKILIVDDEEMIRAVLREYIEFEGGEADEACDGMDAVKMARENNYDVILMDVMMPRLDGFSAVKEIRKFKQTPVIMLSARGEEYDKLFGFEIGSDDYVTKPFSPKEVMARIHAVMKRGKPVREGDGQIHAFEGPRTGLAGRSATGWRAKSSPASRARAKLSGRRGSSGFMPSSPATMARSVPWPRPVVAKLPYSPMSARTGASPRSWRAVRPMRAAPAVWLEEGPIMTGPRTSNRRIACKT